MNAEPSVPTRVRWILVVWIAVIGAISFLDRVNISIAGHFIAQDFHLTNAQLGRIFSAFSVGYMLFQVPGGWLADRFGPRRVLALGVLWWAVFTSLSASVPVRIANALLLFWMVRFLLGIGESVMYPTSNRWLSDWMPIRERGLANGIIFAGVGAGAAITPPIVAALMVRYGWRPAFHVCALLGLVGGLIWLSIARNKPQKHPWVNSAELELIEKGIDSSASKSLSLSWSVLLSSKDVWALTFSYFCYGYTGFIFFSWFFIYLTTVRGLDLKSGSYYSMLPFLAMSVCSAAGGLISDAISRRFGRRWGRCGVACFGLSLAAVFVALGSMAHSAAVASIILAGGAGALYLSQSAYWAVSADLGGSSSGTLSGMMNMGCQSGSAITAAFTPVIADHIGWTASFFVASAFCILGALTWLIIDPSKVLQRPRPAEAAWQVK
jgi:ACS family glucarate transporter-like MFS transporter